MKTVLDVCCGPHMFWFNKTDKRALFIDNRSETHTVTDRSHGKTDGKHTFSIKPDILASFESLPFADNSFPLVVFDLSHLTHAGQGHMIKKYGLLRSDWRKIIGHGFIECFRVLAPFGTLVFKWSESNIPVAEVLALTPEPPLFGQITGTKGKTHWLVFQKTESESNTP